MFKKNIQKSRNFTVKTARQSSKIPSKEGLLYQKEQQNLFKIKVLTPKGKRVIDDEIKLTTDKKHKISSKQSKNIQKSFHINKKGSKSKQQAGQEQKKSSLKNLSPDRETPKNYYRYQQQTYFDQQDKPSVSFQINNLPTMKLQDFIFPKNSNFQFQKAIGALWKKQNCFVCVQKVKKQTILQIDHPNILKIHGKIDVKQQQYLITQAITMCSLKNLLEEFGTLHQTLVKQFLKQIIIGLKQLHSLGYYHNYISLNSIYCDRSGRIVIDSNVSKITQEDNTSHQVNYYSPQILLSSKSHNKADIWSIGCIALELLTGQVHGKSKYHPYYKYNSSQSNIFLEQSLIVHKIRQKWKKQFKSNENITDQSAQKEKYLSTRAINFIQNCLNLNQSQRPILRQIQKHVFLKN